MISFSDSLKERFVRYTAFDTQSDSELCSTNRPSTPGQEVLLIALRDELREMGVEAEYTKEKVTKGILPGDETKPVIGFMAHVDTASDCKGNGVKAQIHSPYNGELIELKNGIVLDPNKEEDLNKYVGSDIITSDGTTLLGADDKAGVAIIMEVVEYLVKHPEINHPTIEIYFTPDEETGHGMDVFPYSEAKSSVCYTLDGGEEGFVETECFNAARVDITIHGVSAHLGSARGVFVNAVKVGAEIVSALPQSESPEATDMRYGYYCPLSFSGSAEEAKISVFIRDFDKDNFMFRIKETEIIAASIGSIYHATVEVKTEISYRNMAEPNSKNPKAKEAVFESAKSLGIPMSEAIIRGGTDGARLSEKGISSPNLFTGGHNYHSQREWVSLKAMENSANLVLGIIDFWQN